MKVFVTGATGNIGAALVRELLSANHTVLGLTRSETGANTLKEAGAEPLHGTLADLDLLKRAATECDAVAHLAFNHDFKNYFGACKTDRDAIMAIGSALAATGRGKAFVITSGTMMLAKGRLVSETDGVDADEPLGAARGASEGVALEFVPQGVRVMVMRLPPVVHGLGSLGFVDILLQAAKRVGHVSFVGTGENRWGAVHTYDAVKLFKMALENGRPGAVYHAVAEEGVQVQDVARAVGEKLGVSVTSETAVAARDTFGMMALAIAADNPSSSERTRTSRGWMPACPGLLHHIGGDLL